MSTNVAEVSARRRVMIVDDHALVRRGVRACLDSSGCVDVVGEAADGRAALDQLAAMKRSRSLPDVVLLDLMMPRLDGATTTALIRQMFPTVRVVILTGFGETERVHRALANGAVGYLLKDAEPAEVMAAIRASSRGEVFLDPAVAGQLTREITAPRTSLSTLTDREQDVLALLAKGRTNQEIADELQIRERTARTHVSNLLRKLRLTSRTQAALFAVQHGLVPPAG